MTKQKIVIQTDNSNWKAPKKRKSRKPMSETQRNAAAERLVKVREKRKLKNPEWGQSNVHETLRDLPTAHPMHPDTVRGWIKAQKELVTVERAAVRQKIKGAIARLSSHEAYIRNMQRYLRDGDWVDNFYGANGDKKIKRRCVVLGYHWYGPKKGEVKRDIGTYYPDLGCFWSKEMEDD